MVSGLLIAFTPDHPTIPLITAAGALVAALLILVASGIIRRPYERVGTVIYARHTVVFVICAAALVVVVALPAFVRFDHDSIAFLLLGLLFAGGGSAQFAPTALRVWAAEQDGFTSQTLWRSKTFLWSEIDWAYVHERRTDQTWNEIKLLETRERFLSVEAGPKRRMKIPISTWLGGDATPLMRAIGQRASNAYFGADKQLEVERHRRRGVLAQ